MGVGAGVRGISIEENDEVVGMICVEPDSKQDVLVLSENCLLYTSRCV